MSLFPTVFGVRHFSSPVRQFASSPVRQFASSPVRQFASSLYLNSNWCTPHAKVCFLLLLHFVFAQSQFFAQVAYQIEYTKVTDVRYTKGLLDTSKWCSTDYVITQPGRKREKIVSEVLEDGNFSITTWHLEDTERPSWATKIEKTVFDQTGIRAFRSDHTSAAFQSFNTLSNPYQDMLDSQGDGQEIGALPLFPEYDQQLLDSFQANGYSVVWQANGDLWLVKPQIHTLKIMPSVQQVENWYSSSASGEVLNTQHFQLFNGELTLRKSVTVDKVELCSGACIKRERKEQFVDYTNTNSWGNYAYKNSKPGNEQSPSILGYPNPFSDQIALQLSHENIPYTAQLIDLQDVLSIQAHLRGTPS
jgi:hypothetical protein